MSDQKRKKSRKNKSRKTMLILASICLVLVAVLIPLVFIYQTRQQGVSRTDQIALAKESVQSSAEGNENQSESTADSGGFDLIKSLKDLFGFGPSQEEKKALVQAKLVEWNDFVKTIESAPLPDEMPQEELDALKAKAIDPNLQSFFSGLDLSADISDEDYEKAKGITSDSFENDYSKLVEVIDQIPYDYIWRLEEDWDRYDFTLAYVNQFDYQDPPEKLDVDLSSVPLIIQWDLDWAYYPYGDLNLALAGCAPTCLSMVLSYLKQDPTLTPAVLCDEAEEDGLYVEGAGSSHDIFPVLAASHNVDCTSISVDQATIDAELEAGHPVILNMTPGIFTHVGHFIVATGLENGKWVINDPNSIKRSNQLWDPETVLAETAAAWSFS